MAETLRDAVEELLKGIGPQEDWSSALLHAGQIAGELSEALALPDRAPLIPACVQVGDWIHAEVPFQDGTPDHVWGVVSRVKPCLDDAYVWLMPGIGREVIMRSWITEVRRG